MKQYLMGWNVNRIIRFAFAIFIIVHGIQAHEWMFIILGGLFALMPLLNIGCAGGACSTPRYNSKYYSGNSYKRTSITEDLDDTQFEEVK